MEPLLSDAELSAVRSVGEAFMTTQIMVLRNSAPYTTSDPEYDPQYDYGDDAFTLPDAETSVGVVGTLAGWFVTDPVQRDVRAESGEIATIDHHILRLPVGSNIRPRDTVRVIATEEDFHVIDTSGDDTWPEWLKVTLRRAE